MNLDTIMHILIFMYGLVFGSFFNVLIYRLPLDLSITKGRSFCPVCHHKLSASDLVPLLSFIFLKGRCRYCSCRISIRYPIIELLTGMFFVLAFRRYGFSLDLLLYIFLWSMLLITSLIDYDHQVIMDGVLIIGAVLGVICLGFKGQGIRQNLLGLTFGFAFYYSIYFITKLIYRKEVFGLGDVYLMAVSGLYLGLARTVIASFMSFYVALIGIILLMIRNKSLSPKTVIPFGPPICIAVFLTTIFGEGMIQHYRGLFSF